MAQNVLATIGLVKKNDFLSKINAVLAANGRQTIEEMADNARQIALKKMGEAETLTNSALTASATAQDDFQAAVAAAKTVLDEKQKAVKADLNAAAVLDEEARRLTNAADYLSER